MERPPPPENTRARILRAALDLFAAQGYQRTPLRQIADRLGLTKAGVLYHYPSKEHLLMALAEPLISDLETALERAARLPWPASRWATLEGWLDTLLRHRGPLGTLYHDMTLFSQGSTYRRLLRIAAQAYALVAGPDAPRLERVRAVQATAMLSDPIVFFSDVSDEELRAEMLDGVARLLGEAPPPAGHPGGRDPDAADGSALDDRPGQRSGPAGSDEAGSDEAGSDQAGSDQAGSDQAGSDQAGSDQAGSDEAGSDEAGSPTEAGPGRADRISAGRHPGPEHGRPGRRRRAGRRPGLNPEQVRTARSMHAAGLHTVDQIAAGLGVSRATLYRHLRAADRAEAGQSETVNYSETVCETN
ncbi:TetR family transcriptional regulator [Plantactinospora sp. WMMB334]|uniref:TetR family transcriptional regulator n=1 Tax=Plantactinospora sp. WMMB334 TaxID=3404119 RepID=UPI003B93E25D